MRKKILKKVLLLSLVVSSLSAANHTVSLDEAITIALQNNNKLKVSQTAINISNAMYNQAMSAHYPTLDVEISAMRLDEPVTFDMKGTTTIDNTKTKLMYESLEQAAINDSNLIESKNEEQLKIEAEKQAELDTQLLLQDKKNTNKESVRNVVKKLI